MGLGGHWSYILHKVIINVSAMFRQLNAIRAKRFSHVVLALFYVVHTYAPNLVLQLEPPYWRSLQVSTLLNKNPGREEVASGRHGNTHSYCRLRTEQHCSSGKEYA